MSCHRGKFNVQAYVPPLSVFHSDIDHKTQPNFNDSNLAFVLKHTEGMHWISSRFRFTVRMKERLTFSVPRAVILKWLQPFWFDISLSHSSTVFYFASLFFFLSLPFTYTHILHRHV